MLSYLHGLSFKMRIQCFDSKFFCSSPSLVPFSTSFSNINQVSPRSLKSRKNIHGKPEIGIDVEEKQRKLKHNISSFARRYFSRQEVQLLNSISDPELQHQEFIKLWTLKEAYVKALGRGFSGVPFKTFNIRSMNATKGSFRPSVNSKYEGSEIIVESLEDPTNCDDDWKFSLLELAGSHYAAICTKRDRAVKGKGNIPMDTKVWKTIPLVKDEYVSGTDSVVAIGGLI